MKIAVDAWGGDHAPLEILKGIQDAFSPDYELVVLGSREKLLPLYQQLGMDEVSFPIADAPQVIEMKEHPTEAIRKKSASSIVKGIRLLSEGKVDAFISAGNSGAVMAAAWFGLRRIGDIERPAITALIPSLTSYTVLLDVGANVDCKPKQLVHFGVMGAEYAKIVLNIEQPKVGLLSNGEEEGKGNELVKTTYQAFQARREFLNFDFVGNVEGQDILGGKVDVVVCDGFTGNALLKFGEGIIEFIASMIFREVREGTDLERMKKVWKRLDRSEYGGAPLLGVEKICLICHGKSNSRDIKSAIVSAEELVNRKIAEKIRVGLSSLDIVK